MPKKIGGKKLTQKEHRMWKHIYESQRERGLSKERAAASATAQVKKRRK